MLDKTSPPAGFVHDQPRRYAEKDWRADAMAAVGEFIGTFTFLLLGLGGIQAAQTGSSTDSAAFLLMAATSMGLALVFSCWSFFRVTGAAFNPNVALTLVLLGAITPKRFVMYCIAQLAGAIAASAVLRGLLPGPLTVSCELSNGTGVAQGLFYEMFLTFGLCLTVVMVAVIKNRTTALAPLVIGFALFSTQLAGIAFTGASVNTARAFGPAVITGKFTGHHWIYWLGPGLGACLAAALYHGLIAIHYWELNPGSDATSPEEAAEEAAIPISPVRRTSSNAVV